MICELIQMEWSISVVHRRYNVTYCILPITTRKIIYVANKDQTWSQTYVKTKSYNIFISQVKISTIYINISLLKYVEIHLFVEIRLMSASGATLFKRTCHFYDKNEFGTKLHLQTKIG